LEIYLRGETVTDENHDGPIRWDISFGNIISLGTFCILAAIAWGVMTERSEATHNGLSTIKTAQVDLEERVRNLETGQATLGAKLDGILRTLERIEVNLEKRRP